MATAFAQEAIRIHESPGSPTRRSAGLSARPEHCPRLVPRPHVSHRAAEGARRRARRSRRPSRPRRTGVHRRLDGEADRGARRSEADPADSPGQGHARCAPRLGARVARRRLAPWRSTWVPSTWSAPGCAIHRTAGTPTSTRTAARQSLAARVDRGRPLPRGRRGDALAEWYRSLAELGIPPLHQLPGTCGATAYAASRSQT